MSLFSCYCLQKVITYRCSTPMLWSGWSGDILPWYTYVIMTRTVQLLACSCVIISMWLLLLFEISVYSMSIYSLLSIIRHEMIQNRIALPHHNRIICCQGIEVQPWCYLSSQWKKRDIIFLVYSLKQQSVKNVIFKCALGWLLCG